MKTKTTFRHFIFAVASALVCLPNVSAAVFWWNQNGTTAGWGTGGTWDGANAFFSTTSSDTATAVAATTTTSDILNFGTSTVGFAGGTISVSSQSIGTIVTGSANTTADIIFSGTLLFAASGNITNNSSMGLIIDTVGGAATRLDLNANGGNITMSASNNTYTGITYINSGSVLTNNAASLGTSGTDANRTVIASGARLIFNNNRTYTERFEIAGAGVGGTSGALVNTGNRTTTLSGRVTLSANATTYSDSTSNALTFGGGIVLGANALTFNSVNAGSIQTVGTTAISGINGSVVKTGSGVLNLNIASSYTGGTTLSAGVINIGAAISGSNSAIGSTSGQLTVNGGTLNMAGNNVTVGNLTGSGGIISGTSGTRTLTIGQGDNGGGNFQGAIQNGSGGTTALTKTGTGAITLSGTNTYSGATIISAGKLNITNAPATSATGTGVVNLSGGSTTTLSGTGISSGLLTVSNASRIAAGINTTGTNGNFGVAGTLSLGIIGGMTLTSANLDFDLANITTVGGGVNDLILTGGALSLTGSEVFTFNLLNATLDTATAYTLISGAGSFSFASGNTSTWTTNFVNSSDYNATYSFSGNNLQVSFTAIPEPSVALLSALGLLALLRRRR